MKFEENWPGSSEEKSFKGVDGRRAASDHNMWSEISCN